ncbi:MAG: hypothetical protein EHM55_16585 [Acidobacteria bacterium]|nr:MAG: hypothetical protein EHM55_16585 [Acidobacteriota bacterium]
MIEIASADLLRLLVLALPVAAIVWTITHEDLFREFQDYCVNRSQSAGSLAGRKFFYLFTCEYCFSHYVSAGVLALTGFHLLYADWRGYLIAWLALVWVANHLISIYGRLRLGIRSERLEIGLKEAVSERAGVTKMEEPPKAHQRKVG